MTHISESSTMGDSERHRETRQFHAARRANHIQRITWSIILQPGRRFPVPFGLFPYATMAIEDQLITLRKIDKIICWTGKLYILSCCITYMRNAFKVPFRWLKRQWNLRHDFGCIIWNCNTTKVKNNVATRMFSNIHRVCQRSW